jgi:hypothetical protein
MRRAKITQNKNNDRNIWMPGWITGVLPMKSLVRVLEQTWTASRYRGQNGPMSANVAGKPSLPGAKLPDSDFAETIGYHPHHYTPAQAGISLTRKQG